MLNKLVNSYKKYKERKQLRNDYITIITTILTAIPDSDVKLGCYDTYQISCTKIVIFCRVFNKEWIGWVCYKGTTIYLTDKEVLYFWYILRNKYTNSILQLGLAKKNKEYLYMLDTVEDYKRNYKG